MNWKIVTIIVGVAIPIIIVAYMLHPNFLEPERKFEECEHDVCVRFCCDDESSCIDPSYNIKEHNVAEGLNDSYTIIKNKPCKFTFETDLRNPRFLEVNKFEKLTLLAHRCNVAGRN